MEQAPWWVQVMLSVLVIPAFGAVAWVFRVFVQHADTANKQAAETQVAFITFLKTENERNATTFAQQQAVLANHTIVSREMYNANQVHRAREEEQHAAQLKLLEQLTVTISEIAAYIKTKNGGNS